tara:strand:- start:400 stop:1785 length:1386 start_codon:yes stop_codon:yes gene_type:complete
MVITSKKSPLDLSKVNRRGRVIPQSDREKVYISTRVTRLGPERAYTYDVDIIQHKKASSGDGFLSPVVIGKRDSADPNKITWNDNAPDIVKKSWNNDSIVKTVKDQMRGMENDFVQESKDSEDYRRQNGFRNFGDDLLSSNPLTENGGGSQDNNKTSPSAFTYPIDLSTNNQDVLKFVIKERKPRKLTAGVQELDRPSGKSHTTIYLPITGQASDTMSVGYENGTLNFMEAGALELLTTALTDAKGNEVGGVGGRLGDAIDAMAMDSNNQDLQRLIGAKGAAAALRAFGSNVTATQVFSRQEGKALNPNLELLFKSPELRNFSFQYKFSPRSAPEAKAVKSIIRAFKKAMAPKRGNEGAFFLQAPDIFELTYLHKNVIHSSMNKFKTCALKSCTVNYAPEGTYATFPDGVMHSYVMSLGFTEIDPVFAENYEHSDEDTGIFSGAGPLAPSVLDEAKSNIGF